MVRPVAGRGVKALKVRTDGRFRLDEVDPDDTSAFSGKKQDAEKESEKIRAELDRLQELLYADHRHAVLIVLQGIDTAGKDGTIRNVFDGVNPQGVSVASFKVPTPDELDHDFLWRVHERAPSKGHITIFNRSHYEDVLVTRVHRLIPKEEWRRRYRAINEFERTLSEEGTTVLKFFLHISKKEQKARLEERLADPHKHWKFSVSDPKERRFWADYRKAYEEAIRETSTPWAPWYAIPSNRKWFRNWAVSRTLVDALAELDLHYPSGPPGIASVKIE